MHASLACGGHDVNRNDVHNGEPGARPPCWGACLKSLIKNFDVYKDILRGGVLAQCKHGRIGVAGEQCLVPLLHHLHHVPLLHGTYTEHLDATS